MVNFNEDEPKRKDKLDEPYEVRASRTVLWEAWGEIPLAYSAVLPHAPASRFAAASVPLVARMQVANYACMLVKQQSYSVITLTKPFIPQ